MMKSSRPKACLKGCQLEGGPRDFYDTLLSRESTRISLQGLWMRLNGYPWEISENFQESEEEENYLRYLHIFFEFDVENGPWVTVCVYTKIFHAFHGLARASQLALCVEVAISGRELQSSTNWQMHSREIQSRHLQKYNAGTYRNTKQTYICDCCHQRYHRPIVVIVKQIMVKLN